MAMPKNMSKTSAPEKMSSKALAPEQTPVKLQTSKSTSSKPQTREQAPAKPQTPKLSTSVNRTKTATSPKPESQKLSTTVQLTKTSVIPKPASPKPETLPQATSTSQATPEIKDDFDVNQALEGLYKYSEVEFDNYDWTQDRRLPSAIYTKIDARISKLKASLEENRPKLQARLKALQYEIDKKIRTSTSQRDTRILQYLQGELNILQELYQRAR